MLLLCGSTPAYRSLSEGDTGRDVRQLNANLVHLGYATRARLDPSSHDFGSETASALEQLQSKLGEARTGTLGLGDAVFLPRSVRIAKVTGELGGSARPGAQAMDATSAALEVQVALDPSQQDEVKAGDRVRITLPGNESVTGRVDRLGRVAQVPAGQDGNAGGATIPAYVRLDDPEEARGPRPGAGSGGDHDQGRGGRPERPGDRARREGRRRVRGRGRACRRATRAGRRDAGPVRHRGRTGRGRGRASRRRSVVVPSP